MEELTGPLSPLPAESDVATIAERAGSQYAAALSELGGSIFLVRPAPGAGDIDPLDNDAIDRLGRLLGHGRSRHR